MRPEAEAMQRPEALAQDARRRTSGALHMLDTTTLDHLDANACADLVDAAAMLERAAEQLRDAAAEARGITYLRHLANHQR